MIFDVLFILLTFRLVPKVCDFVFAVLQCFYLQHWLASVGEI